MSTLLLQSGDDLLLESGDGLLLEAQDATWFGTSGTLTITGTSGSFTPGAVTWIGTSGSLSIVGTSGAFDHTKTLLDAYFWIDFNDETQWSDPDQYPTYGTVLNGPYTSATDPTRDPYYGGRTVATAALGSTLFSFNTPDGYSWDGGATEVTVLGKVPALPAGTDGIGLWVPEYDNDYPALVAVNNGSGVYHYAIITGYATVGGMIRTTTKIVDTAEHVWSLRLDGADTKLYVDGVECAWAGAAIDASGSTIAWDATTLPAGIGLDESGASLGTSSEGYLFYDTWGGVNAAWGGGQLFNVPDDLFVAAFGFLPVLTDAERLAIVGGLLPIVEAVAALWAGDTGTLAITATSGAFAHVARRGYMEWAVAVAAVQFKVAAAAMQWKVSKAHATIERTQQ